jgi:dihydroorotate dehydrogenase electron transfer subunit
VAPTPTPTEIEVQLSRPEPGPRTTAPFGRRACAVVSNEAVGAYRLVSVLDPHGPHPQPGQFYMLAAVDGWGSGDLQRPYLARAFSVCRARVERLEFLVEGIGPGTDRLAALQSSEQLWLVGPLGVGFSVPGELIAGTNGRPSARQPRALLVGGGAGVAPLAIWSEALEAAEVPRLALLGFRGATHCDAARLLASDVVLATDDGTRGHRGVVTDLLAGELARSSEAVVYACGPPAMLETVRSICVEYSVPAELALEEAMACGFGACFGCVVRTRTGYRRICVDGPVVRAADLDEHWIEV